MCASSQPPQLAWQPTSEQQFGEGFQLSLKCPFAYFTLLSFLFLAALFPVFHQDPGCFCDETAFTLILSC